MEDMKFKLRQMEVFRAVMLTGSVSRAARMLFVSQPVVSRTLAHIEQTLGLALFERKGGAIAATEDARILFREVEEIYGYALRVDDLVHNLRQKRRKRIAFCASPALGLSLIPAAIKKFRKRHDDVRFTFKTALIKEIPMELLGKSVDFALSIWPIEHPNLVCTPLSEGSIVLIAPHDHALASCPVVQLSQLQDVPLISYLQSMPIGASIREALSAAGVDASPIVEINRSELACALVHQGVGVALVNSFCVDEAIWKGLAVKAINLDIPASIFLITSRFETLSEDSREFVAAIQALTGHSANQRSS